MQDSGPVSSPSADPDPLEPVRLLSPGEVARLFAVNPKTVSRWARDGRISSVRTPGGHRRYLASEIEALLRSGS